MASEVGVEPEVRYFMSLLDMSKWNSADVLALIREHWSIEHSLHLVKDRWREEDKPILSMPGLGEHFTCLLNRVVSVGTLPKRGRSR